MNGRETMIVVRFQQTFPLRVAEWLMAGLLITIGGMLATYPDILARPPNAVMAQMAPNYLWAGGCLTVGLIRFAALVINGAWRASPHIRAACAFVSCFAWLQFVFAFASSQVATLGLAIYPWFLMLDTYNVFRASADARIADDRAKQGKSPH